MAEAHDQHLSAIGQMVDCSLNRVRVLAHHMAGQALWKNLITAVDPSDVKRQMHEHTHQSVTHMTSSEEGYWRALRPQTHSQISCV